MSDDVELDRERRAEEQRESDRRLIEAVESRRSVGEELARTGATPVVDLPPPAIRSDANWTRPPRCVDRTPVAAVRVTRRRRIWPRVLQVLAGVFALVVLYFLFSLWQVWSTGRSDRPERSMRSS